MRLCVLLGGPSAEREVSLMSGSAMARALAALGHEIVLLDPATGRTMRLEEFQADPPKAEPPTPEALGAFSQGSLVLESLQSQAVREADVVVFGLHGVPGEDGIMQSVLELLGKPYTGTNARMSALCIDKDLTKVFIANAGVPVPKGKTLGTELSDQELKNEFEMLKVHLGLPMVIKPNDQGSTVGLTILKEDNLDAFIKGVRLSLQYSSKALVEEFVDGRELTVAVIGNEALPIVEIAPEGGFYDYHHKYTKGMTVYTCPAQLETEVCSAIQADALKVFEVCGARGYARIDFRLRPDNTWACLEINTLPGMTETSLVPKAAKAHGLTFEQLCERILASALVQE